VPSLKGGVGNMPKAKKLPVNDERKAFLFYLWFNKNIIPLLMDLLET
jgi:hypothetical protein